MVSTNRRSDAPTDVTEKPRPQSNIFSLVTQHAMADYHLAIPEGMIPIERINCPFVGDIRRIEKSVLSEHPFAAASVGHMLDIR